MNSAASLQIKEELIHQYKQVMMHLKNSMNNIKPRPPKSGKIS
jgi:hypothetical protein